MKDVFFLSMSKKREKHMYVHLMWNILDRLFKNELKEVYIQTPI